ncbi:TetR/AcrR family transcriptional regulator [Nocardia sp. BMG51109]|uniref:TetR/AcrR family transcriptional regulator n=1 Tax=Nocardia sp. BMG51109 TaxID=1056816 RepID=UPI0004671ECC|nr:TetR/AcrR family transcriptional regulator [Nocardia sp. BMG51109]
MVDKAVKPLRADARRNRELVLATAGEMLSAEGMAVSFDEIARRAGVGVGTVYRHFPTRDALLEAVLLGRLEQFVEQARTLASADAEPGAAFLDYFARLVGEVALNQALCEALESDQGSDMVATEKIRDSFRREFGTLLRRAQSAGAVRSDLDAADVQDLLVGAAAAERRARLRGAPNYLLPIVLAGLRPE